MGHLATSRMTRFLAQARSRRGLAFLLALAPVAVWLPGDAKDNSALQRRRKRAEKRASRRQGGKSRKSDKDKNKNTNQNKRAKKGKAKGATLAEVKQHVESVRTLTAARVSLVLLPGSQGELLKFFTTSRRRAINLPELSHNVTSDGMAVLSGPLGFRRRSETDGIFWGIGSSGGSDTFPLYWNGFGQDPAKPAAYHGLFLGKSGYGKTVSMNALLYREAMRGSQVVRCSSLP